MHLVQCHVKESLQLEPQVLDPAWLEQLLKGWVVHRVGHVRQRVVGQKLRRLCQGLAPRVQVAPEELHRCARRGTPLGPEAEDRKMDVRIELELLRRRVQAPDARRDVVPQRKELLSPPRVEVADDLFLDLPLHVFAPLVRRRQQTRPALRLQALQRVRVVIEPEILEDELLDLGVGHPAGGYNNKVRANRSILRGTNRKGTWTRLPGGERTPRQLASRSYV